MGPRVLVNYLSAIPVCTGLGGSGLFCPTQMLHELGLNKDFVRVQAFGSENRGLYMEDPIVIPTAKSVQLTLQRSAQKTEHVNAPVAKDNNGLGVRSRGGQVVKLLQAEVNQKIADWQNELSTQSSLINTLEELLKADLEALKAGKPPPEDNEDQRKVLSNLSPKVAV